MNLLVDANNVLSMPGMLPPELAGIELSGLIGLMTASRRYRSHTTWLVCDGGPSRAGLQRPAKGVVVQYAGPDREADDVIEHRIDRADNPRLLIVVSSDRRLRKAARRRRCRVLGSDVFLTHLLNDYQSASRHNQRGRTSRPHQLTPDQVKEWIDQFDLSRHALLEIPASGEPFETPAHPDAESEDGADANPDRTRETAQQSSKARSARAAAMQSGQDVSQHRIASVQWPMTDDMLREARALVTEAQQHHLQQQQQSSQSVSGASNASAAGAQSTSASSAAAASSESKSQSKTRPDRTRSKNASKPGRPRRQVKPDDVLHDPDVMRDLFPDVQPLDEQHEET